LTGFLRRGNQAFASDPRRLHKRSTKATVHDGYRIPIWRSVVPTGRLMGEVALRDRLGTCFMLCATDAMVD
jgi:hypothetical protein